MINEIHITQMKQRLIEDPAAKLYVVMRKPPEYVQFDQIQYFTNWIEKSFRNG